MKKIPFFLFAAFFAYPSFAAEISTKKCPVGLAGYKNRNESHNHAEDRHALHCSDPGDKVCQWQECTPQEAIVFSEIDQYVQDMVESGVPSGAGIEPETNASVNWSTTLVNGVEQLEYNATL